VHTRGTCDGVYTSDGEKGKELMSGKRKRKKKKEKEKKKRKNRNVLSEEQFLKNNLEFFRVIRFF